MTAEIRAYEGSFREAFGSRELPVSEALLESGIYALDPLRLFASLTDEFGDRPIFEILDGISPAAADTVIRGVGGFLTMETMENIG